MAQGPFPAFAWQRQSRAGSENTALSAVLAEPNPARSSAAPDGELDAELLPPGFPRLRGKAPGMVPVCHAVPHRAVP